jgi:energy-coupling factor transporter ATP-binding protein EcfA2
VRIEAIELKRFRGATAPLTIQFDGSRPLVLIFGENGSGKSTLVDALDFVCNQRYGSLEDRSSAVPKRHLPSIGSTAGDLLVTLDAGGQRWIGRLESSGPRTSGPPVRPSVAVLRRSQVLRIINEQPKKRYEALGDLLGLPGIRGSEETLREATRDRENRLDEAARAKQQADEALQRLWEAEGSPSPDALSWGRQRAAADPASLAASLASRDAFLSLLGRVEIVSGEVSATATEYELARATHLEAERLLGDAERLAKKGSATLVDLLEDARRALAGHDPEQCPVCESGERVGGLATRIEVRLTDLKQLVEARSRATAAQLAADRSSSAVERATAIFTKTVRELAERARADSTLALRDALDWSFYPNLLDPNYEVATQSAKEAQQLWTAIRQHGSPMKEGRDADQKALHQLTSIKQQVSTIESKTAAAKDLETSSKGLRQLLNVVEAQRKQFVDDLLAEISTKAQAMYARVHPGEDLGNVRFFLKPSAIGSLECDGTFEGSSGVPPQAYYSDSHLDTLGVCVFLALAQTAAAGKTVAVLDDVLTSVDAPHAERLMKMLQDELQSFEQIIVTTHYRPWRERFRLRGADNVQLIDLSLWTLARGIWPTKTTVKIEELRSLVAVSPFDRQAVASKAGVFLEELLRLICMRYRGCKVPLMAESNLTLGDLVSAIPSKLERVLRAEKVPPGGGPPTPTELGPLVRAATQWAWVRNGVGAHFNVPAMDVPDDDVRAFAVAVIALGEHLVCDGCGESPTRNRSGSYFECKCAALRLHPALTPGETAPPPEA